MFASRTFFNECLLTNDSKRKYTMYEKIRRGHERIIAEMCCSVASWCRWHATWNAIWNIFFPRTTMYRKWRTHQKAIFGRLRIAGAKPTCYPGIWTCISFSRKSKAMQLSAITHSPFPLVSETHFSSYIYVYAYVLYIQIHIRTHMYTCIIHIQCMIHMYNISIRPTCNSISCK